MLRVLVVFILPIFLIGCDINPMNTLTIVKRDVEEYNQVVDETIRHYEKIKSFANGNKDLILNYSLYGDNLGISLKGEPLPELDDNTKELFKTTSLVYDKYFTAIGSNVVHEVIVVNGKRAKVYITIVWDERNIQEIGRVVEIYD